MTVATYWETPYCRELSAEVVALRESEDGAPMFACSQTVFYPRGGGQPGDIGEWRTKDGGAPIADTVKMEDGMIWHVASSGAPEKGAEVNLILDWTRRHQMMRTHTAMHLLYAAVSLPVTGSSMRELRGRLDFDCPTPPVREEVESTINGWIAADTEVKTEWADSAALSENPQWARAMFAPPPDDAQRVRIVNIVGIDIQACGGTHVKSLGEIGLLKIVKMEKKGRINRRMVFALSEG